MINFYMTPGSCSTGIHILLEELGLVFSVNLVNLMAGDQHQPEFFAINPKSTIPVLVLEDGRALTSFQGICWWLAQTYPKARLLPETFTAQAQALDLMGYIVNTIHGEGYTRIFTPKLYCNGEEPGPEQAAQLRQQGEDRVACGLELVSGYLDDKGRCLTEQLNVVDAALFYVEFWADRINLPLPERCAAHYQWMKQRPVVKQVLAEEGYRL